MLKRQIIFLLLIFTFIGVIYINIHNIILPSSKIISDNSDFFKSADINSESFFTIFKEPSLYELKNDLNKTSYRFIFSHSILIAPNPVIIRVDIDNSGKSATLYFKTGMKHYNPNGKTINEKYLPSTLEKEKIIQLNSKDIKKLNRLIDKEAFWHMASEIDYYGMDGYTLTMEGLKNGNYHAVQRWSPEEDNLRILCYEFLELSGQVTDKALNEVIDAISYNIMDLIKG